MQTAIKASLGRKIDLCAQVELRGQRVGGTSRHRNSHEVQTRLCKVGGKMNSKGMWAAVRELTGRKQQNKTVGGVTTPH